MTTFCLIIYSEKNEKDIYFYRETIVQSLENRSVDLLTISSFKGISEERECRLFGLFPNEYKPRSHIFKNKKVLTEIILKYIIKCFKNYKN